LYFSLILKPGQSRKYWPLVTHVASIALVDTLKALTDRLPSLSRLDIDIKWPNDVLLSGKKAAGILLEASETEGKGQALVLGLGINVHKESYPESLKSEAICLDEAAESTMPRRQLLVQFLFHFQAAYQMFEKGMHAELLERWKALSSIWNEVPIWIREGDTRRAAVTCGLNELGALLVRNEQGTVETLVAGDISIRAV
jgi:BirA family biotin operon repressor/biotin-[acetyl-CoA-carboxylase] ligase